MFTLQQYHLFYFLFFTVNLIYDAIRFGIMEKVIFNARFRFININVYMKCICRTDERFVSLNDIGLLLVRQKL